MVLMPLLGWLTLSAGGKAIPLLGFELPALLDTDKNLADQLTEVHEPMGTVGCFLIGAQTPAAAFQHTIRRDNTLRRMGSSGTPKQS